jgi:hypothetical protein
VTRFCQSCGIEANAIDKYCASCGVELKELQEQHKINSSKISQDNLPEKIRENLKRYSKHLNLTCLECGYVGLMGVSRVDNSKKNKWGIWILVGFGAFIGFFLGFVFAIIFGLIIGAVGGILLGMDDRVKTTTFVICPSCLLELKVN